MTYEREFPIKLELFVYSANVADTIRYRHTCASKGTPLVISSSAELASAENLSSPKIQNVNSVIRLNRDDKNSALLDSNQQAEPGRGAMLSSNTSVPWNGNVTKSDLRL